MVFRSVTSFMTPNAEGKPPRSAHQTILEEVQARADHVIDMLPICQHIMAIGWAARERERVELQEDTPGRGIVLTMITEARYALQYMR